MQRQSGSPPSESAASGLHPQKDPELWFEDGNVVVVARDSAAFCVHTGVLARHSEVFQNMFGVPQPPLPAPSDIADGRPVVHVSDSAHDFKQLLHMLYDGTRFMLPDQPVAFDILAAVARLGHKYHVEWVLEEAKRRLGSIFKPSSYEEWWKQEGRSSHLVHHIPSPSWVEALNLIQLLGETDMMPVAIYQCCQFRSVLFKGTQRADGTSETLDLPTLEQCCTAHVSLVQRQSNLNADIFCAGPSERCPRKAECGRTILETLYRGRVCTQSSTYLRGSPMHGGAILRLISEYEGSGKICNLCATALIARDRDGRTEIWRSLPSITGIAVEGWDQLVSDP